ncbi:MAG TPA: hypothetical protein VFQ38_08700, partial [Longimicrobiales bacterium]|nr:hypothetical protein [Longimicrobiales bacterium]
DGTGSKAAFCDLAENVPSGSSVRVRLRLAQQEPDEHTFGPSFDAVIADRCAEADEFYDAITPPTVEGETRAVFRQALAGLLWTKQYYCFDLERWLAGDPNMPPPPPERRRGRNREWRHLFNSEVLSMPDKWEYPWYAAWDLAFHCVPLALVDPDFAKQQLTLLTREWYMHPNGQLPAYEWAFGDVNPPVHAWAVWRVYKMTGAVGKRDRLFLERAFQKLLLNFTWWVNRKDPDGNHLFSGGFLGLDNIGIFDRSQPLPGGGFLEQADGTAWMAFFCSTMLAIALELAAEDAAYEDVAAKFFEHYLSIVEAIYNVGGVGLWDERDGFFYDHLHMGDDEVPLRIRSMVGLVPLFACEVLNGRVIQRLPAFAERVRWLSENRPDLTDSIAFLQPDGPDEPERQLLAIASRERLERVLGYLLDESEFLSPYGIRSLSRVYRDAPYTLRIGDAEYGIRYTPAESDTGLFGGNSNWRGPVWFPLNYLLIEALERYHHFYGDTLTVECPAGSGRRLSLYEVARELARRLVSIFIPDAQGRRPVHGAERRYAEDPHWRDLLLFHEYFCGDTGRGVGASHQTGWTALVVRLAQDVVAARSAAHADPVAARSAAHGAR